MDVAESNSLTLPINGEAVGIDTILVNHETLDLFSTLLGELHVVSIGSGVVAETNDGEFQVGVVLHDAGDGLNLDHLVGRDVPIIVSIEDGEGESVVVELVGFEFVEDVVQAVGDALSTDKFILVDVVCLGSEFLDLVFKFLLVILCLGKFVFHSLVLSSESVEVLLGEECALCDELSVGRGDAKVEEVTNGGQEVGVVNANAFFPESGGIADNIAFKFEIEQVVVADTVAGTDTGVELDTSVIHGASLVDAPSQSTTSENVDGETTVGIPVVERVVQREHVVGGDCEVSVHGDSRVGNAPVGDPRIGLSLFIVAFVGIEHTGPVAADAEESATVDFFLEGNSRAKVQSATPERTFNVVELLHIGLVHQGDVRTDTPIAPETILRILGNLLLSKGTACKSYHAEQYREF